MNKIEVMHLIYGPITLNYIGRIMWQESPCNSI